ncbi:SigE family RNA polymerase sigma factor [Yinghuangia sp. ASG 101]|uniref:SigE family RNA polymerase sigma factor n=1 Tax=Yinghuangia sp. ASG 101 TaxID=2896848 RepID=UPI001E4AD14F|nr:SigE family RNA polymerase sigma factor [Yinghuangia sp. ASG 101]UGQ13815.1 SigE family RNA polymerase sigma factor [Yinghuangia sp. ASG 101]
MATHHDEFLEFATARSAQLFRTAWLLCGDWHLAEDLVQTTLGKLYRSWRRVKTADNPDAYARTVLTRSYLSWRRRRSSGERPYAVLPEAAERHVDPSLRLTLLTALAELPRKDRTVLVLRFWEDLSVEQTARQMGCSPGAVRNRSQRALARLRTVLGDEPHLFAAA